MVLEHFSISDAYAVLKLLVVFIAGMVIYSIFIFKFYKFLARKDIFKLKLYTYYNKSQLLLEKMFGGILYVLEYLLLFPIFTFFWFIVLAVLFSFLSKNTAGINFMISMALVASVRVTSYYTENLSQDLAKMIPFALLGVFLVDIGKFTVQGALQVVTSTPSNLAQNWIQLSYYFAFVIIMEFILRIYDSVRRGVAPGQKV